MLLSNFTTGIVSDLEALAGLGDDSLRRVATQLASALEPSLRGRVLDVLNDVVAELNATGGPGPVEIRIAGDDVTLVWRDAGPPPPEAPGDLNARVALRLPDDAKSRVEERATREGVSINSWIVRSIQAALEHSSSSNSPKVGRTLRGSGRS